MTAIAHALFTFLLAGFTCEASVGADGALSGTCRKPDEIRIPHCAVTSSAGTLTTGTCCFANAKPEGKAVCADVVCFPGKGCQKRL